MADPNTIGTPVPASTMKSPGTGVTESKFQASSANTGNQALSLTVAQVTAVDYEKLEVTLRTQRGEILLHAPIPMAFPSAGARHFLGALPLPGDTCVVGWGNLESGKNTTPIILSWIVPNVTAGHDWWVTQPFSQDEFSLTPKEQVRFEGIADRVRHKLRHMLPGNIIASSAQGSDLVLNESATLTNRRGNEIRLRDQDQAIIMRSLQQFQAGAGFRVYGGMVQRDATFLPTSMVDDGVDWDAPKLLDAEGLPLNNTELGSSGVAPGVLTPNPVFKALGLPKHVDPYMFLQKGLFVDARGRVTGKLTSDAVYGGKSMYRVSVDNTNAVLDPQTEALTEYRIEVAHSSDGTLPVTEQTDGFDADRLPDSIPRVASPNGGSPNFPFIEWVMGSPVGNDPFSLPGKALYGHPLLPVVFDGDDRSPKITSGVGSLLTEHAATLLKVTPPMDSSAAPTWWSLTKEGRLKASIAGPGTGFSAEVAFASGLRVGSGPTPAGDSIRVDADGRILFHSTRGDNAANRGVEVISDQGAVRIFAGGSETVGGISQRNAPVSGGESGLPGLTLEAATNVLIKAGRRVQISAPALDLINIAAIGFQTQAAYTVQSGDTISHTSNVSNQTTLGKATETYAGPKNGLPTNGALREVQFVGNPATGFPGGPADKYSLLFGDRQELLTAGNHTTTILVGAMTYTAAAGAWTAIAGANSISLTPGSASVTAAAGPMTFTASAGAAVISGSASVAITSLGAVLVKGSVVTLSAPSPRAGPIISASDIDPTSGAPFGTFFMGSPTHLLAAV